MKTDRDLKTTAANGLKSAMVVTRSQPIKENFIVKPSSQRYAELPSLRYGATPNPTAAQIIGSGPLRVSVHYDSSGAAAATSSVPPRRSNLLRYTRRYSSFEVGEPSNFDEIRNNSENVREEAPPVVRRVRFAELPPKNNPIIENEVSAGVGNKTVSQAQAVAGVEQWMRSRIGIPPNEPVAISSVSRLPNNNNSVTSYQATTPGFQNTNINRALNNTLTSSASFPSANRLQGTGFSSHSNNNSILSKSQSNKFQTSFQNTFPSNFSTESFSVCKLPNAFTSSNNFPSGKRTNTYSVFENPSVNKFGVNTNLTSASVLNSTINNKGNSTTTTSFVPLKNTPSVGPTSASGRIHDTARYRRGTLPHATGSSPPETPSLPPLLRAAKEGDDNELSEILRKGVLIGIPAEELNAVDNSGRTALSYIASNGTLANLEAILQIQGVDVNKHDNEGNTPLHFAAQAGQVEVVNYLLSRCTGLEVDARNSLGFTPLMKAALQGRTKCAKLLLFAGASPTLRDSGRGLRAEQWARFCGRYVCAEVIEKFARHRLLDRNTAYGRWGSEPELAARLLSSKSPQAPNVNTGSSSIKSKLRKAFRTTSNPGPEPPPKPPFSIVTQLTSAALCASSPVLPSSQNVQQSIKSLMRPLSVPKVQVTLAGSNSSAYPDDSPDSPPSTPTIQSSTEPALKDRPPTARPNAARKKKK